MQNSYKIFSDRYANLSSNQKHLFLLIVIFYLTIECRILFQNINSEITNKCYACNELIHKLASSALAIIESRDHYPDVVLFSIIEEISKSVDLGDSCDEAIKRAFEHVT